LERKSRPSSEEKDFGQGKKGWLAFYTENADHTLTRKRKKETPIEGKDEGGRPGMEVSPRERPFFEEGRKYRLRKRWPLFKCDLMRRLRTLFPYKERSHSLPAAEREKENSVLSSP